MEVVAPKDTGSGEESKSKTKNSKREAKTKHELPWYEKPSNVCFQRRFHRVKRSHLIIIIISSRRFGENELGVQWLISC